MHKKSVLVSIACALVLALAAVIAAPRVAQADASDNGDGTVSVTGSATSVVYKLPVRVNVTGLPSDWSGYSFKVTLSADADSPASYTPVPYTNTLTISSSQSVEFEETWVNKPGTYVYDMIQTQGDANNMTYDVSTHRVTVTVTTNADGNLVATYPSMTTIENTFTPSTILVRPGVIQCKGQLLKSNYVYPSNFFTYVLKAVGDDAGMSQMAFTNGILGPAEQTASPAQLEVNEPTNVSFNQVYLLNEAGTHYFEIYQQIPSTAIGAAKANASYQEDPVYVRLQVHESPQGVLSYTVEYGNSLDGPWESDPVTLYNGYDAQEHTQASGTVASFDSIYFAVAKTLNGRDSEAGESYTFTITALDVTLPDGTVVAANASEQDMSYGFLFAKNASGPLAQTVTVSDLEDGVAKTVKFAKSYGFYQAGTFRFKVVENAPTASVDGMTYDTAVHYITVVATLNEDGTTSCTVSYDGEAAGATAANFVNTYTAPAGGIATQGDEGTAVGETTGEETGKTGEETGKTGDAATGDAEKTGEAATSDAEKSAEEAKTANATTDTGKSAGSMARVSAKSASEDEVATPAKLPQTGDTTQAWLPVTLTVVGVVIIVTAVLTKKFHPTH